MKTSILAVSLLTFAAGAAFADKVRDWHDLDEVHTHIVESIHEMERASAANHYDMAGRHPRAGGTHGFRSRPPRRSVGSYLWQH